MFEAKSREALAEGHCLIETQALLRLSGEDVGLGIQQHFEGEWGDLEEVDVDANRRGLGQGGRVVSQHRAKDGTAFWILTDPRKRIIQISLKASC